MKIDQVFVYGTLKAGNSIRGMDRLGADFVAEATTTEAWFDMVDFGPFPAVVPDGESYIAGEVWQVDNEIMEILDQIEGYPHFYKRQIIETTAGPAWMYYLTDGFDTDDVWLEPDSRNVITWNDKP